MNFLFLTTIQIRKILTYPLFFFFLASLMMVSCKKGDTGPAGTNGADGNANVIYSGWKYGTNFRDTTIDNSNLKIADLATPEVVDSSLNSTMIMVYFTYGSGVFPLPYTSGAGTSSSTISFFPKIGKLIITRYSFDNSGSVPLSPTLQYRYILIPGGKKATSSLANGVLEGHASLFNNGNVLTEYNNMSYEEACRKFNIQP